MKRYLVVLCLLFAGCSGSTSFLGEDFPSITLIPGVADSVMLLLEAEGSHAGEYGLSASVEAGEGLSATIDPTFADIDGVLDVTVTVSAADDAPAGSGIVYVEATNDKYGAGTSISVTVE